ncbi:MAG: gamma carbonic anhydrase family protein [Desulfarculaceae bacterium]|nr:gamma carbonic anhydrase family protein [Desulfarculaceae bacterium]
MALYQCEGKTPQVDPSAYVHPQAALIGEVSVAAGCFIGAGAALRGDLGRIEVGRDSNVQENCVLHMNPGQAVIIGRGVIIGHGAILHDAEVGDEALIGMASVLLAGVRVGAKAMVAAGSLLPAGMEVPPEHLAQGNPARIKGPLSPRRLAATAQGLELYKQLAARSLRTMKRVD